MRQGGGASLENQQIVNDAMTLSRNKGLRHLLLLILFGIMRNKGRGDYYNAFLPLLIHHTTCRLWKQ